MKWVFAGVLFLEILVLLHARNVPQAEEEDRGIRPDSKVEGN